MRITERAKTKALHLDLAKLFSLKKGKGPSAEFRAVPAARQERVTRALVRSLEAALDGQVPRARQPLVKDMLAHVGKPDFYDALAKHDPAHAQKWTEMARVQRDFAKVEPEYDAKTRAYSESMRLTLHASVLQHLAKDGVTDSLYERFIELHPTAFHENGGWVDNLQIPLTGAMAVAKATPAEMWLNAKDLADGALLTDAPTVKAAELVRAARREALAGWR